MQEELLNQILFEIKGLKSDVIVIKSDINELKSDVNELKSDINELKSDVSDLKLGQQRIEIKLDAAYQKIADNSEGITEIKVKLNHHANFMGSINERVTNLENQQIGAEG